MDPDELEDEPLTSHDEVPDDLDDDAAPLEGDDVAASADQPEDDPLIEPRQPTRRERAVIEQRRRAQEAETRASRLETELAEIRRQISTPREDPYVAAQRAEAERIRLESMSYDERLSYEVEKARRDMGGQLQAIRHEMAAAQDEAKFERMAAQNPMVGRLRPKVEELYAQSVRNGQPVARTVLAQLLAGQEVLARAPKARAQAERVGRERIRSETGRAGGGGSDVRGGGRADPNSLEAIEARLRGVPLDRVR